MTNRRVWLFLVIVASAVAVAVATFDTNVGNIFYVALYGSLCATAWAAVRRVPAGPDRRPWTLAALAQTLWLLGDLIELAYLYLSAVPSVSVADVCWLGGYALLAAALTMMARRRAPGRMRGAVLDALTLTVAAALVSWQYLIVPWLSGGASLVETVVPPLYPVADIVLLTGVLFIALSPGTRGAPTRLALGSVTLYLAVDLCYNVLPLYIDYGTVQRIGPVIMLGNALLIAACLHPSRDELTRAGTQVKVLHPARVLFLGLALLTAPTLTLVHDGLTSDAVPALLATALGTGFVLTRFTTAVREQERAQAQLLHQAHHDPLTGLANRSVLTTELARTLPSPTAPIAVLYLDLDGFKQVNDAHGHEAGDLVLTTVANRLSAAVRETDLVVRLGGDEFVLLCPGLQPTGAIQLAERVVGDVARPIPFGGVTLEVGVSVGIAACGSDAPAHEGDLLRSADAAMYEAKTLGRGRWVLAGA